MKVKRQERGWGGHFICADRCRFRRNTLLTYNYIEIVVSTVGLMKSLDRNEFETIGYERYYETMAFFADSEDIRYHDIDVGREVSFDSEWSINKVDVDDMANDMHEAVVKEISNKLVEGETYDRRKKERRSGST